MVIVTYELNLDYECEAQDPVLVNYVLNHERRAYDTLQGRGAMKAQRPVLVNYVLNHERRAYDTPQRRAAMFDYVLAADGLYLHAKREELEICLQVAPAEVRGLDVCFEKFGFGLPKVATTLEIDRES